MMHDNLKFLIGLSEEVGRAGCQRTWTAFLESAAFVQFKVNYAFILHIYSYLLFRDLKKLKYIHNISVF